MRTKSCFLLIAISVLFLLRSVSASDAGFDIQEVADGIHVHHGRHELPVASNMGDIANIGFIIGERCVAVIDPGGSKHVARQLQQRLQQATKLPVCYVILTHIHPDHLLGASVFTGPDVQVIGHQNLPDLIFSNQQFFIENFLEPFGEAVTDTTFVKPDLLVSEEQPLSIDLGQRKLTITAWPVAHTHSDITIHDHKTNIAWISDLLFMDRIPPLDGSLRGWVAVNEKLIQLDYDAVIPGHGPVIADWPAAMQAQQRYLGKLLEQTRAMIAAGEFLETALEQVAMDEQDKWLLFNEVHRRNVTRAFAELEWE